MLTACVSILFQDKWGNAKRFRHNLIFIRPTQVVLIRRSSYSRPSSSGVSRGSNITPTTPASPTRRGSEPVLGFTNAPERTQDIISGPSLDVLTCPGTAVKEGRHVELCTISDRLQRRVIGGQRERPQIVVAIFRIIIDPITKKEATNVPRQASVIGGPRLQQEPDKSHEAFKARVMAVANQLKNEKRTIN